MSNLRWMKRRIVMVSLPRIPPLTSPPPSTTARRQTGTFHGGFLSWTGVWRIPLYSPRIPSPPCRNIKRFGQMRQYQAILTLSLYHGGL